MKMCGEEKIEPQRQDDALRCHFDLISSQPAASSSVKADCVMGGQARWLKGWRFSRVEFGKINEHGFTVEI